MITVIGSAWRRAGRQVLDILYPPVCIGCREQVSEPGALCPDCWQALHFLDGPVCAVCGLPFEVDPGSEMLCAACHAHPPAFDKARAVLRYDDTSSRPVLALKYADRLDLVPAFGRWLERAGRELLAGSDLLVPVPLHRIRLWRRRYNQAAELARALSRLGGIAANPLALSRIRATPSQGDMPSASARRRNVRGAFTVQDKYKPVVVGKRILLVDDVLTTGATASACAKALKRAGANKVFVLALARVVRPLADPI
ncbi:MAG: ComF family protein [Alphaproteobacteria bacterium]|nr:ComF family protein [Alphaproteobacteria bacterium]MDE2264463.1 ComF family protein [Alphaproteobacteria bacterium]MDE2500903.1 ComF family protein [Alphaproteobacteria bacterium]